MTLTVDEIRAKNAARMRVYRAMHPDKVAETSRKSYLAHKEKRAVDFHNRRVSNLDVFTERDRKARAKKYEITIDELFEMFEAQGYSCAVCGSTDPSSLKGWQIDHDHSKKGRESVRGILCRTCNINIGHFQDNALLLRAAADYLEECKTCVH
jgi:hypothetical protein